MSKTITVPWSRIINGEKRGDSYIVPGLGIVSVTPSDEADVAAIGGDPLVELSEGTASDAIMHEYSIGHLIPREKGSELLAAKDSRRLRGLQRLYEESHIRHRRVVGLEEIGREEGWTDEEIRDVAQFLIREELAAIVTAGSETLVRITHKGGTEAENSIRHPNKPTEHFGAQTVQNIHHMTHVSGGTVGAIVTGSGNTTNIQQNLGADAVELLSALQQARVDLQQLPPEEQAKANEYLDAIEAEVRENKKSAVGELCAKGLIDTLQTVGSTIAIAALKGWLGMPE